MIRFTAFCLCMAKIRARLWARLRARLWARQLKMCLGKTVCLGHLRRWHLRGFQQGVVGLFGNANPPLATWAPKAGGLCKEWNCHTFHRGRAFHMLWHHARCLELLLKNTLARDPCAEVFAHLCYDPLRVQQMQPSGEKYQSHIHGTFFVHLSCPNIIFLCPALFIRDFFGCRCYTQWWS